ncbi:MAG: helix-turn-helix domain-containing protein [Clostridiales bacterium]|nr:helix-turn-helix domain-containing protein [Clostridiales bacterium]
MYFDAKEFGQRLGRLRRAKGLSQALLAEKLNNSRSHVSHMEVGTDSPSIDLLIDLSEFFQVSLDYLILGKQEKDIGKEKEKLEEALRLLESIDLE